MLNPRFVQVLTCLLLLNHCLCAQSTDPVIQKLLNQKLIERNQVDTFERFMKQQDGHSNASYLYALLRTEIQKRFGEVDAYTTIVFDNVKPGDTERTKIQKYLSTYLSKLMTCGLITEKQFRKIQPKMDDNKFVDHIQLLNAVGEQVAFDEYMDLPGLKDFGDKLKESGIVTTKYSDLIQAIEREELETPIGLLRYCDKAVIIHLDDYPAQPGDYLEKLHRQTAGIIPDLVFNEFSFQVVIDSASSFSDSQSYDFVISLKSKGRTYKQKSFYRLYSREKDEYFGVKIDQQEYYKVFNKILADIQSPYRLHEVKAYNGNAVDENTFGIIALTRDQARMLHGGGVYFSPSYESFRNSLTTDAIELAIDGYQKMGLLNHLKPEQILAAKQVVSEREIRTLNDVLACFPDVIHMFDMELANLEDPYVELLETYRTISHRDFNPTDVSGDFDLERNQWATLKFTLRNTIFERKFRIEGDWIDPDFFEFIDNLVRESSLNGQFYELYTGGQEASVIYLTKAQYELLRKNKWVVFADEAESVRDE